MKRNFKIGLVSVIILTFAANCVLAAGPRKGRGGDFLVALNLTYAQQEKVLEIRHKHARETQPLRQNLQKKRLELKKLWAADKPNEKAITAKMQQMVPLQVKLRLKKQAMFEEIAKVLTPDQLKQLKERKAHSPRFKFGGRRGLGERPNGRCKGIYQNEMTCN